MKLVKIHGRTPQILTTGNGGKYVSREAKIYYASEGVTAKPTVPYQPQKNGIAESLNGTLVSATRAALYQSKLPPECWEDALRDAVFKYNPSIYCATGQIPHALCFGTPPSISALHASGQLGTVAVITDKIRMRKLHPRAFAARYMYAINVDILIVLNHTNGQYKRIRTDVIPYRLNTVQ